MSYKKYTLAGLHIALSLLLGYVLSAIKLFEALYQPTATHLTLGFIAVSTWYCILFINFLLSFANQKKIFLIYSVSSIVFGLTYYINSSDLLFSTATIILYFLFLLVTQYMALQREKTFVRFSVHTIFFPVVRRGMFFLLILFAIMGYSQANTVTSGTHQNKRTGTEALLQIFIQPVAYALNKQVNTQIASQHTEKIQALVGNSSKAMVTKIMLEQTIKFLGPSWTRKYIGVEPQNIPIDSAIILADGSVDMTPVVVETMPKIARYIDQTFSRYLVYIPLILALFIALILQPFFYIASFLFSLTAPFALFILFKTGFLIKETIQIEKEIVKL